MRPGVPKWTPKSFYCDRKGGRPSEGVSKRGSRRSLSMEMCVNCGSRIGVCSSKEGGGL